MLTNRPPIHPGEILLEEFMKPNNLTSVELSEKIGISCEYVEAIINNQQVIDISVALYLSELFGTSPELWLNGQMQWDIWHFLHGKKAEKLKMIQPIVKFPNSESRITGL
ncbi:HigA family addiction module antitoxin [Candidatus Halobeggiatoa sp. HSG11]|nr:HigA family addiction module antitoxin [Candidatus Halobeggiatoa sp. HSG11]